MLKPYRPLWRWGFGVSGLIRLPADPGAGGNRRDIGDTVRDVGAAHAVDPFDALTCGLAVEREPCRTREVSTVRIVPDLVRTRRGVTRNSTGVRLVAERRSVGVAEADGAAGVGATTAARHQNSSESE